MRALVAYLSYSGNTKEAAELIMLQLESAYFHVDMHRIGIDPPIDAKAYDVIFIGTFTWDMGSTPDEVKDFVLEIGYKPDHVALFGTGDTQFGGDDLFCKAVDKLVSFYQSRWEGLKLEQSPRGSQETIIEQWVEGVIQHVGILA
ncbi:ribonucleotide reductase-associated flavodoxin, putative [Oceanobacillus limi]|uniref:Ribonucleotide reductase-associated flavodoxin, putative n=1 Tax=Oceanobacillus limi TaxID=930131 RepID=A0A1I0EY28_9BACI|nr:flavodoxin [Oceanobacillus limi]SET50412.1 ribonucleotide reductase-associated flavodoxin, putative [Oceanobacillus limi]